VFHVSYLFEEGSVFLVGLDVVELLPVFTYLDFLFLDVGFQIASIFLVL